MFTFDDIGAVVVLCVGSWGLSWDDVVGGVIAGLIGSVIVGGFSRWLRWRRTRTDFGILEGTYKAAVKSTGADEGTATLTGRGPTFRLEWIHPDNSTVSGQVVMNEQSRVTGAGSYMHTRGQNVGWGTLTLQVVSRDTDSVRLLVDGVFTDQNQRTQIASAWTWEKV